MEHALVFLYPRRQSFKNTRQARPRRGAFVSWWKEIHNGSQTPFSFVRGQTVRHKRNTPFNEKYKCGAYILFPTLLFFVL